MIKTYLTKGPLAQLGEHRVRNAGVVGSSPTRSTIPSNFPAVIHIIPIQRFDV